MYYATIDVNSVLTFFMLDDLFDVDGYKKLCLNDVHSLKTSSSIKTFFMHECSYTRI